VALTHVANTLLTCIHQYAASPCPSRFPTLSTALPNVEWVTHTAQTVTPPHNPTAAHLMKYAFGEGWVDVVAFKQLGDGLDSIPAAQESKRVFQGVGLIS